MKWLACLSLLCCVDCVNISSANENGDPPAASAKLKRYCDHDVVLDKDGKLLPWTSYDHVLRASMKFIELCPTVKTKLGDDPWYLVTSKLTPHGEFLRNQNCQGSHAYWSVETAIRYYPYSGDEKSIEPTRAILERVLRFSTPADWNWANVPRTQDNSPDGEYTDEDSEPDKICLVGAAYIKFYKLTGEEKWLTAAVEIARTVAAHVKDGDAKNSPLPFRVNLKKGNVIDEYTSDMTAPALLFDMLVELKQDTPQNTFRTERDRLWQWVLKYPLVKNDWSGYYEDVFTHERRNMNQQIPMETARFMMRRPELDPDYKKHVPELLEWVKHRFGRVKRAGATGIKEQDICNREMSSHTARYASIAADWFGVSNDPAWREEALRSFALATYSAIGKDTKDDRAVNYVGIGYVPPWFIDSYFDYLPHILDGMAQMPEMAPADADHILGSNSVIQKVRYEPKKISYTTFEPNGKEILRITFKPDHVAADGHPLAADQWTYGDYRGVPGVLRIERKSARNIVVE